MVLNYEFLRIYGEVPVEEGGSTIEGTEKRGREIAHLTILGVSIGPCIDFSWFISICQRISSTGRVIRFSMEALSYFFSQLAPSNLKKYGRTCLDHGYQAFFRASFKIRSKVEGYRSCMYLIMKGISSALSGAK